MTLVRLQPFDTQRPATSAPNITRSAHALKFCVEGTGRHTLPTTVAM